MNETQHKCSVGSLAEVSAVERELKARGYAKSSEGQSQKHVPPGEYVIVSLANVRHHKNGEIQYRIAWVEEINDDVPGVW